ncbi:MAG: Gfo/Idh/MocA family protein [Anaerolineae bacterium]
MVNIGVIGCGGMGKLHSRSLGKLGNARIVAAADADAAGLAAYASEFHPDRTHTEYAALLEDPAVEAVLVCVPTYMHPPIVQAAARAGKQVFCEKPIALSVQAAEEMVEACDKAGVLFMMGFVRRFDNDWGTFRQMVQQNEIGRPIVWRHVIASGGPSSPWYNDREKGGGPIVDGAIHDIDFANWLFGDAVWTAGVARSFKSSAYDTVTVSIGYEKGDELLLSWTWGLPLGGRGLCGQDALGPNGSVLFPGSFPQSELPEGFDAATSGAYLLDKGSACRTVTFPKNDMFLEEMRHFLACCESGQKPAVTGEEGLKAITVCLRALAEARKA